MTYQQQSGLVRSLIGIAGTFLLGSMPLAFADEAADELSAAATDPTASLMSFNIIGDYTGAFYGPDNGRSGDAFDLTFRPVIPFKAFGKPNILRMTVPYQVDGRGGNGINTVSLFDLVIFGQQWGRLGLGAVVTLAMMPHPIRLSSDRRSEPSGTMRRKRNWVCSARMFSAATQQSASCSLYSHTSSVAAGR